VRLEKFYLDLVSDDGGGAIVYTAQLAGLGLAATPATTLRWTADRASPVRQTRTLRGRIPAIDHDRLNWHCPALDAAGSWLRREPPTAEQILWSETNGALRWEMLMPRARVELRLGTETLAGWGYAERLRLDLPPWRLPITSLRWGRFVAETDSVVWIAWEHESPRRWLWHNGRAVSPERIDASGCAWAGHTLVLKAGHTLRSGRLANTAFARWPRMQRWLPRRILNFEESKWCARASLITARNACVSGWAIHEVVRLQ
jgi:hypothetical protein